MFSTQFYRVSVIALLASLSACKSTELGPQSVSIEQAKQITTSFSPAKFTIPPRSTSDILDVLKRHKNTAHAATKELISHAESQIVPISSSRKMAELYFKRAHAAKLLGRINASNSDYRKATDFARRAKDKPLEARLLGWLANNQLLFGNFSQGLKTKLAAVEVSRGTKRRGRLLVNLSMLAKFAAKAGKLDMADTFLSEAWEIYDRIKTHPKIASMDKAWMGAILRWGASGTALARGELTKANRLSREAISLFDPFKNQRFKKETDTKKNSAKAGYYLLVRGLANVLRAQGRMVEAEAQNRKSLLGILEITPYYSSDVAWNIRALAKTVIARGRAEEAQALTKEALNILKSTGVPSYSMMMVDLTNTTAKAKASLGLWDDVVVDYEKIKSALPADGQLTRSYLGENATFAQALVRAGRAIDAEQQLRPQLQRLSNELGDQSYRTARLRSLIGVTLVAQGRKKEALLAFKKSIPIYMEQARKFPTNGDAPARARVRRFIIGSYIKLLSQIQGTSLEKTAGINATNEAFKLSDLIRNETVRQSLDASSARAAARDPELADLARREQDAKRNVAGLSTTLNALTNQKQEDRDLKIEKQLIQQIAKLNASHTALSQEIRRQFPEYTELLHPRPVSIEKVRTTLHQDEALLSFLVLEDTTYVWSVPKIGPVTFVSIDLDADKLNSIVSDLRRSLAPAQIETLGDIPNFDVAKSHDLYKALISPVKKSLSHVKSLIVITDGALGHLPLGVLTSAPSPTPSEGTLLFANYRNTPWLIKDYEITNIASVSSFHALRSQAPHTEERTAFLGIGDPVFNRSQALKQAQTRSVTRGTLTSLRSAPKLRGVNSATLAQLPRLADTATELHGIAKALGVDPKKYILLGKDASETRIKTMNLANTKVLVFATHGLLAGDLDGLDQPALALSSPKVVGGTDDGLLTMGEILGLKLNADWAVLSACNTGLGNGKGAEAVSGLGSAFFYAGARALLVSNWPVHSQATSELTQDLFQRQADSPTLSRAAALQGTLSYMIDQGSYKTADGRELFSYAHPLFWAPFTLIGDGT